MRGPLRSATARSRRGAYANELAGARQRVVSTRCVPARGAREQDDAGVVVTPWGVGGGGEEPLHLRRGAEETGMPATCSTEWQRVGVAAWRGQAGAESVNEPRSMPRASPGQLQLDGYLERTSTSSARTTLLGVGARARLKSTREPIGQEKTGSSRRAALAQKGPGGDGNLGVGLAECDLSRALALAPRPFLNNGLSMCNSAGGKKS